MINQKSGLYPKTLIIGVVLFVVVMMGSCMMVLGLDSTSDNTDQTAVKDENQYACKILRIKSRGNGDWKRMVRANRAIEKLVNNLSNGKKNALLKNQYSLDLEQLRANVQKEKFWITMPNTSLREKCKLWKSEKEPIKEDEGLKPEPTPIESQPTPVEPESPIKKEEPVEEPVKEGSIKEDEGLKPEPTPSQSEEKEEPVEEPQTPSESVSQPEPAPNSKPVEEDTDGDSNNAPVETTPTLPRNEIPIKNEESNTSEEQEKPVDESGMPLPPVTSAPEKESSESDSSIKSDESGMPIPPTIMNVKSESPIAIPIDDESEAEDQVEEPSQNNGKTEETYQTEPSQDDKDEESETQSNEQVNENESNTNENQSADSEFGLEGDEVYMVRKVSDEHDDKVELYDDEDQEEQQVDYNIDLDNAPQVNYNNRRRKRNWANRRRNRY